MPLWAFSRLGALVRVCPETLWYDVRCPIEDHPLAASREPYVPEGLMRKKFLRSFSKAFLQILSTEGQGVRLCWEYQKLKDLKVLRGFRVCIGLVVVKREGGLAGAHAGGALGRGGIGRLLSGRKAGRERVGRLDCQDLGRQHGCRGARNNKIFLMEICRIDLGCRDRSLCEHLCGRAFWAEMRPWSDTEGADGSFWESISRL